jgi:hypothetical protein
VAALPSAMWIIVADGDDVARHVFMIVGAGVARELA